MDSGRRHKTPGSETKDFVTHDTASGTTISIFAMVPLAHKPPVGDTRPRSVLHVQWVCVTSEEH